MSQDLNKLIEEYETQMQVLTEKVKAEFSGLFTTFLDKYPQVEQLRFAAFTPYFNDGDPCIYSVHDMEAVLVKKEDEDEDEDADDYGYGYGDNGLSPWSADSAWPVEGMKEDFKNLNATIHRIPNTIMERAFDEGLFIIDRDGVRVEEFEHD